jgi:hypothetical protein
LPVVFVFVATGGVVGDVATAAVTGRGVFRFAISPAPSFYR